jgi:hypothetical protein
MREVVRDIYEFSDRGVVMSTLCINLLQNTFHLNSDKAVLVPHEVPTVPGSIDTAAVKRRLGLSGKFVIASYACATF